jgi:hypothetical protein
MAESAKNKTAESGGSVADAPKSGEPLKKLTPEEQMALYE